MKRLTSILVVAAFLGCVGRNEESRDGEDPAQESSREGREDPPPSNKGWKPARRATRPPAASLHQEEIDRLQALGYVDGSEAPREGLKGVTVDDSERSTTRLNLVVSGHGHEASLMDTSGRILHAWRKDVLDAFPGDTKLRATHFRRAHLFPNGDLLVLYARADGMVKLDRCSNVIWATRNGAHHDFQVQAGGEIYALVRKAHIVPQLNVDRPIVEDYVVVLGPAGEERERVSLLSALMRSDFAHLWEESSPRGDVFHTNSVDVLQGEPEMQVGGFGPGRVLVSMRRPSLLAVLDMEDEVVVWATKGDFRHQHAAQLLESGRILLFDNSGLSGKRSRVLELDVATGRIAWEYRGNRRHPFHSPSRGQVQRFQNGNTLVTDTDSGRAFEITPDGEIVWEFFNPHRAGREDQFIAALLDVRGLPPSFPLGWVEPCSGS